MNVRLFPLEIRCTSLEMFYVKLTHVVDDMHLVSLYFIEYAIFKNSWKCNVDILSKISIYDITPTQLNLKSLFIVRTVCEYVQKYWSRLNSIQLTSTHQTRVGTFLMVMMMMPNFPKRDLGSQKDIRSQTRKGSWGMHEWILGLKRDHRNKNDPRPQKG